MPVITLPDGSQRSFDHPVTVYDVAADIGPGLAKAALGGKIEGRLVDSSYPLEKDTKLTIITERDMDGLEIIRHSCAHLLAQAVKALYPEAQVTIGPVIEDGFYYDFAYPKGFTPEDLEAIEAKMRELVEQDLSVHRELKSREEAVSLFRRMGEEYKAEIIASIPSEEEISLYRQGDFVDLCRGPHVPSTARLKAFKLTKVAGAYWRGDANNEMLQRIYGTAWPDKKALKAYLHRLEEAEKRDHRRIGADLDLFSIQEEAGGGLVFWHPMGARIRRVIEDFWQERHTAAGYEMLYTPHIAHEELWQTSGHTDFYRESMYQPMEDDHQLYQLKPMNCPFHVLIYQGRLRSYRELPIRWAELGTVYRHEMSGALHGLMRVRGFTQDDAHIFCREEQIENEILGILDLTLEMLAAFGFDRYEIDLSTRPEKSVGPEAIWEQATQALRSALDKKGLDYAVDEGGGAFYGPKIDIKIEDAIGRKWQCSTVQLDFNLPERFAMEYVAEDGARHRPIMIHRAVLGSLERFFGVLIEHYEGKFPPWLAPVQVVVMSITDRQEGYARQVEEAMRNKGFRSLLDLRNEKIGFKIREHILRRIPYLLVIGDREVANQTVAVRTRYSQDLGAMSLDAFMEHLSVDVARLGHNISEED
ncbi:Ser-tRNA(Thr) hydrolase / threonyl-tRNA synthetase [Nitrosococcus oceani ATCC 19707]|uniref:Threonine--tRNA ligase n=3 Tax=Nitrosococcus oceani TaxID=1229 RepID=SYT_NITOC|nr:threonine--tRNA ligase [Nitrosococcus oceani]Q3JC02.1 RecName: Full=Threonine--tRNA ligase; AltName: Full=Threonyl-tRNA synthetase; Short=ThrRS [Nitrosococcus oceani ATCC 19707]ABA57644.1 Ser-tRNA(Thr) hydrolase / threonyl-tRNA synthetase [Nitrosococcus oceani ATCC 19707]KFI19931.1 threonyl-tRNA synthetase [Nitrosococcus oceani C-27]GEM19285.1 threonine--tRNA ligase [Nitrosococcus oceani]